MNRWMLKQSSANMDELTRQIGDPVLARILAVRGYRDAKSVADFLLQGKQQLASPLGFADMQTAVEVVAEAIDAQCRITVYGDYDADGVMSSVILLRTLRALGADAEYYIPNRSEEGYGMNERAMYKLMEQGTELIIACDNGISAIDQVELANELGMTVVILDHHAVTLDPMLGQILPPAEAVVDAKRIDCCYPFKSYCAAGLCYRFSEALFDYLGHAWLPLKRDLLPFAAFATITDLVELTGENRILVRYGLPLIKKSSNPGLRALLSVTGLDKKDITPYHVGFILGPCVNAAGRMSRADIAVELFMTDDAEQAAANAEQLLAFNEDRRKQTDEGTNIAVQQLNEQGLLQDSILVLHCQQVEESVAGIIAGRLKERYDRPVVMLAGRENILHGSARSVEAYNIFEGLSSCRDLFINFGGHPMAAGLTINAADVPALRERLNSACKLTQDELKPILRIDCPLLPSAADLPLAKRLSVLEPFGKDNPVPLFVATDLRLLRLTTMGREQSFLRWQVQQGDGKIVEFVDFSGKERLLIRLKENGHEACWEQLINGKCSELLLFDMVYTVSVNEFNGRESAQLRLEDFRPAVKH